MKYQLLFLKFFKTYKFFLLTIYKGGKMRKLLFTLIMAMVLFSVIAIVVLAKVSENRSSKEPLEKIEFIHWKKDFEKPAKAKEPKCYKFLTGSKIRWKTLPVSYVINPTNSQNLEEDFIKSAIFNSTEIWDANTSKELMNNYIIIDEKATYGVQDYVNAISFGDYPTEGVIAVTTLWYNPATREIVEFDIMFDTDWTWGDAGQNSNVMDLQNIATHEFGHAIGLGDVYNSACSEVTMYGYSEYGETRKRTLEIPDITGLQTLYGA